MPDPPPIPPRLWERLLAFLAAHASGQIVLHVEAGQVRKVEYREVLSAKGRSG